MEYNLFKRATRVRQSDGDLVVGSLCRGMWLDRRCERPSGHTGSHSTKFTPVKATDIHWADGDDKTWYAPMGIGPAFHAKDLRDWPETD